MKSFRGHLKQLKYFTMNRDQNSTLTRGKRVIAVLIVFQTIVDAIMKLKSKQTSLTAHVAEADKFKDDQIRSTKGHTTKKKNYKNDGIKQAVIVAGIVREFAIDTEDDVLAEDMNIVKTDFDGKGELALSLMNLVLAEATTHKLALADYGLTLAQLTAYKANVDGFEEELNGPSAAIGHKHFDTTELEKELLAVDEDLASIEKIMENQAEAQPEFYSEFISANNNGVLGRHKVRNPLIPVGTFVVVLKDKNTGNIIVGGIVLVAGETETYLTSLVGTPSIEAEQGAQKVLANAIFYKPGSKDINVTDVEQTITIEMEPLI